MGEWIWVDAGVDGVCVCVWGGVRVYGCVCVCVWGDVSVSVYMGGCVCVCVSVCMGVCGEV